jgi:diguanylate cyclase (GGDEF)-like protein/PAS domain S-box-containing protein
MGTVVVAVDREGRIAYFSTGAERLTGYRADEVLGRPLPEVLLPADEVPAASAALAQLAAGVVPDRFERDWLTRSGQRHRLAFVTTTLTDGRGDLEYVVAAGIDVTVEREAQELVEAVLAATTEQAVIATDTQGRIIVFNAGAERMLGHQAADALGQDVVALLHDPGELQQRAQLLDVPVHSVVARLAQTGQAETRDWTYRRRDRTQLTVALSVTPLRHRSGALRGYLGVAVDVTAVRQQEQQLRREAEQLAHRATHDALTGLANRSPLLDRLSQAAAARRRHGRLAGLLYLDVDGLKTVNDVHGHAAGDALLVAVAQRLASAAREGDLCARLGGDEFALLVEDLHDQAELDTVAERVHRLLAEPVRLPTQGEIMTAASIGTALIDAADGPETVLARADAAMYAAKITRRTARTPPLTGPDAASP